jgi:toxin ParE1/3/4
MSRYRLSDEAKLDAKGIRRRIVQDNAAAADRMMAAIRHSLRLAAGNLLMGQSREDLGPGYRVFSVGNYVIVFCPMKGGIQVVRIIHGARDFGLQF